MNRFLKYIIFGSFEAGFWGERHSGGVEKWIFRLWMYPVGESHTLTAVRSADSSEAPLEPHSLLSAVLRTQLRLAQGTALGLHWSPIHTGARFTTVPGSTPLQNNNPQPYGWGLVPGRGVDSRLRAWSGCRSEAPLAPHSLRHPSTPLQNNNPQPYGWGLVPGRGVDSRLRHWSPIHYRARFDSPTK